MPNYNSDRGVWHPKKERIALKNLSDKPKKVDGESVNPGEEYIYKGPDRAALFELYKEKVETFGQNFRTNPEFLQAVRNQGYQKVDDYLEAIGYDEEGDKKKFEEKSFKVNKNEMPKRVEAIKILGGGTDTTGSGDNRYGGFGPQPKD